VCLTTAACLSPAKAAINYMAGDDLGLTAGLLDAGRNPYERAHSLSRATFSRAMNTEFLISSAGSKSVKVKLVKIVDFKVVNSISLPGSGDGVAPECFSVVFRGPHSNTLEQGTYRVEHKTMGRLNMFLVPASRTGGSLHYEAVFYHL
jgi:hypothetical protein